MSLSMNQEYVNTAKSHMIAELKFSLPDEREELNYALNATKFTAACQQFAEHLRRRLKYEDLSSSEQAIYEKIQKEFYASFDRYDIDIHG